MKYIEFSVQSLDRYSAQNDPDKVCAKMNELGMPGFAMTQTALLTAVETMRHAAKGAGLKFIPGVKTYYRDKERTSDLRLIALDYAGYMAIAKAVTDAQNDDGYAVMTRETLEKFFAPGTIGYGHVVATSAGMDGVLSGILNSNSLVDKRISELKKRFKAASGNIDTRVEKTRERLAAIETELGEKKTARDAAKKLSESKFEARQKRVDKLEKTGSPDFAEEQSKLEADRKAASDAKQAFEDLKKEVTRLLKRQTTISKELKELESLQDAHKEYAGLLKQEEAKKKSDEELAAALKQSAADLSKIFGPGNFYIEIQYHRAAGEKEVFTALIALAKEVNLPLIAANDVHIIEPTKEERLRRQILRSLRDGDQWIEEQPGDEERYIKTGEEMYRILSEVYSAEDVTQALENTGKLFDRAEVSFPEGEKHYPKFPGQKTANEMLEDEIAKGIEWRFPNGFDQAHKDRLEHEVKIIEGMGYADYHLIVKDFLEYGRVLAAYPPEALENAPLTIEEAKKEAQEKGYRVGIATGPGRGSAVGSLVCYLLGITSLDPLKYDLLFERFLNPERVSMPDIDSDLSNLVRPKVIQYVQHKYGENSVCGILTMDSIAPKGAIRTAAKYYGLKNSQDGTSFQKLGDQMARLVPDEPGTSFSTEIQDGQSLYDSLTEKYKDIPEALEILYWAKVLEGSFTTFGVHAGGVVISDENPITEYMPMRWNKLLSEWTTQCDMYQVEERGLIKMDFLGLKTLDVITEALRFIAETTGTVIDPLNIPIDDKDVFREIFAKANTGAAFQFESSGMRAMLKRFKPETFEDLIILVSMFRPGPLQYIDEVIAVKNGTQKRTYLTKELEPILGRTYCGIVYQEQVMEIFQKLAGYTLGGADMVRRAMSKKKMDKLAAEREAFINGDPSRNIDGCIKRGIKKEAAEKLFDQMTEFAKYAFNKSHAAAYALVAYWTGWLKFHYPAQFICAAMNWADSDEKLCRLIREADHFGVQVMAPDVNASRERFSVAEGKILYGLSNIKAVGADGAQIAREREENGKYSSLKDLLLRVPIRKNACENLIKAGAMDCFCHNRKAILVVIETFKKEAKKYLEKDKFIRDAEMLLDHLDGKANALDVQKDLGLEVVDKNITPAALKAKIDAARQTKENAEEALEIPLAIETEENLEEKLEEEHSMLRAYITGHPLDAYESAADGVTPIEDVDDKTQVIMGLITELSLKNRKSDGKPMAFFTLEDKTGSIECAVFTTAYAACGKYLKERKAVVLTGHTDETEAGTDENGVVQKKWQFIADTAGTPSPAKRIFLPVSSYYRFHAESEAEFRKLYETPNGYRIVFFDETLKEAREATYRVSEKVLDAPKAKKI